MIFEYLIETKPLLWYLGYVMGKCFFRLQFSSGSRQTADYQRLRLVLTKFVFIEAYAETHSTQKQSPAFTEMLTAKVNFYSSFKLQQAI